MLPIHLPLLAWQAVVFLLLQCVLFVFCFQQNEAKLDEILKELKSLKDTITHQDERISKLEQQMAKIAV